MSELFEVVQHIIGSGQAMDIGTAFAVGMQKANRRERMATAVLAGLVTRTPDISDHGRLHENRAENAIAYADALIQALDKETP